MGNSNKKMTKLLAAALAFSMLAVPAAAIDVDNPGEGIPHSASTVDWDVWGYIHLPDGSKCLKRVIDWPGFANREESDQMNKIALEKYKEPLAAVMGIDPEEYVAEDGSFYLFEPITLKVGESIDLHVPQDWVRIKRGEEINSSLYRTTEHVVPYWTDDSIVYYKDDGIASTSYCVNTRFVAEKAGIDCYIMPHPNSPLATFVYPFIVEGEETESTSSSDASKKTESASSSDASKKTESASSSDASKKTVTTKKSVSVAAQSTEEDDYTAVEKERSNVEYTSDGRPIITPANYHVVG